MAVKTINLWDSLNKQIWVLVSTIEIKASYVEIFLDSAYDMKFKFEPVIIPNKGDNT